MSKAGFKFVATEFYNFINLNNVAGHTPSRNVALKVDPHPRNRSTHFSWQQGVHAEQHEQATAAGRRAVARLRCVCGSWAPGGPETEEGPLGTRLGPSPGQAAK